MKRLFDLVLTALGLLVLAVPLLLVRKVRRALAGGRLAVILAAAKTAVIAVIASPAEARRYLSRHCEEPKATRQSMRPANLRWRPVQRPGWIATPLRGSQWRSLSAGLAIPGCLACRAHNDGPIARQL